MSSKLLEKLLRDGSLYDGPHKPKELKEIFVNLDGGNLRGTEGGAYNPPAVDNVFLNRTELLAGVSLWSTDKPAALAAYGDISNWNVTAVSDMSELFKGKNTFNDDISNWDVSNVTNMKNMFGFAGAFNQDISSWDVSSVTDMGLMFAYATIFNGDISSWNVGAVTEMDFMFTNADAFDQDIGNWNVSSVTDMKGMFFEINSFNQDIGGWDVSNVTDMTVMFNGAIAYNTTNYDALLIGWSALTLQSNVIFNMNSTTKFSSGAATTARGVLTSLPKSWTITDGGQANYVFTTKTELQTAVNLWISDNATALATYGEINTWVVSAITNMSQLFIAKTNFNDDISNWDVSSVTNMGGMFGFTFAFNQDIGGWNVSSVTNMGGMFNNATAFNQDIGNWDVSNVTSMDGMFADASSFNQPIGDWNVSNVTNMVSMFTGATAYNTTNYDLLLIGWSGLATLQSNVIFNMNSTTKYSSGAATSGRLVLTSLPKSWAITDGGQV